MFSGQYPARWVPRESGEIIGNLITDDELCFGAPRKLLTLGEVFFASEQIALGEIPTSDWPIYCNFAWKVANYDSRGAIRRTGRRNAKRGLETHAPLRMETNSNREQKQLEIGRLLIEERLPIVNERCADLWAIAICDSSNATMAGLGLQIYQAASRLFQDLQTRERSVGE